MEVNSRKKNAVGSTYWIRMRVMHWYKNYRALQERKVRAKSLPVLPSPTSSEAPAQALSGFILAT